MAVGGAESSIAALIRHLRRTAPALHVEVMTLHQVGVLGKELQEEQIPLCSFNVRYKYDLRTVLRLVRLVQNREYDVVHTHLFPASYVAALASIFAHRPKWIFTEHNVWNKRRNYGVFRIIEKVVYSRFLRVIAVSHFVEQSLLAWMPYLRPKLLTIPNGVVVPELAPKKCLPSNRPLRFLFVGRLEYVKGLDLLLEALGELHHCRFELWIAGDGRERERLQQLAAQYGLSHHVSFLGLRRDIPALMQTTDCLVLPSRWEGLPVAILEAMASGLPVMATAVGGVPEVIEDGVNGYLVASEDVVALRQRLQAIMAAPQALSIMGERARESVMANYAVEVVAAQIRALYDSL